MSEKLKAPQDVFHYKLGAALTMENTVLEMLGNLEESAQQDQLTQQFRHHADETRQQIANRPRPALEGSLDEAVEQARAAGPG